MIRLKSARSLVWRLIKGGVTEPIVPTHLNEAVNFDYQAIFIAVPKTGTTSIRRQLAQPGPSMIYNPHLTILQVRDSLYSFLLAQELGHNLEFPTDPSRVPSDEEIREKAAKTFNDFFKFASVRNPWARALSLYKRREGVRVSDDMDFETFCEQLKYSSDTCHHPTRLVNQLDWMTDESGELLVDYVLRLEDHEEGIREIHERTNGRIKLKSLRLNNNPDSSAESYRDVYSSKAKTYVEKTFNRDIEFFGYEF